MGRYRQHTNVTDPILCPKQKEESFQEKQQAIFSGRCSRQKLIQHSFRQLDDRQVARSTWRVGNIVPKQASLYNGFANLLHSQRKWKSFQITNWIAIAQVNLRNFYRTSTETKLFHFKSIHRVAPLILGIKHERKFPLSIKVRKQSALALKISKSYSKLNELGLLAAYRKLLD